MLLLWEILVRDADEFSNRAAAVEFADVERMTPRQWEDWRQNLAALIELAEFKRGKRSALSRSTCAAVDAVFAGIQVGVGLHTIPGQRDLLDQVPAVFFTNRNGERVIPEHVAPDTTTLWQRAFYEFFNPEFISGGYCENPGCHGHIAETPSGRRSGQSICHACRQKKYYDSHKFDEAFQRDQIKRQRRYRKRRQ